MQRLAPIPHPVSEVPPGTRIDARIGVASGEKLAIHYLIVGAPNVVRPARAASARVDGLWRRTCFEVFIRKTGDASYFEFNFSPSGEWAAYRFTGYREGMEAALQCPAPEIVTKEGVDVFELRASMQLSWLPFDVADSQVSMGVSAVLEHRDGEKSYWALAHPPGAPDFHHPSCFAYELPREINS